MTDSLALRNGGWWLIVPVVVAIVLVAMVWQTYQLLLIMFGGVLLAVFLRHGARLLGKLLSIPPALGVIVVAVLATLFIVLTGWLFASTFRHQIADLSRTLPGALERVQVWMGGRWVDNSVWRDLSSGNFLIGRSDRVLTLVSNFFSQATSLITAAIVAATMAIYMAIEPEPYLHAIRIIFSPKWTARVNKILSELYLFLWWWMLGRLVSMFTIGCLTLIGLNLLGVPYSFVLALIAGLLTIIPYLGPMLSAIPAVLVGLSVDTSLAVGVLVMFAIVQMVEDVIVTPLVERKTVRLPPAITIGAQLFFGVVAGPVGVVLASPLTVVGLVVAGVMSKGDSRAFMLGKTKNKIIKENK